MNIYKLRTKKFYNIEPGFKKLSDYGTNKLECFVLVTLSILGQIFVGRSLPKLSIIQVLFFRIGFWLERVVKDKRSSLFDL